MAYQSWKEGVKTSRQLKNCQIFELQLVLYLFVQISHPILTLIASLMATKVASLKVCYLRDLKSQMKYVPDNDPVLVLGPQNLKQNTDFGLEIYIGEVLGSKKDNTARRIYTIFRRNGDVTHLSFLCSRRLRCVSHSSSTAQILAAADRFD